MSLAQALAAQVQTKGPECSVAVLLRSLPPDDAATLETVMAANQLEWPHTKIAEALADKTHMGDHAVKMQAYTISRHRKGKCACGPC
jgi:thioesterase domain-containing protein